MNPRRLYKSRDRRLAGVAGGMAEYLDIDPTIMRILWILAGLLSVGFAILAYILLAIVIPDAPWASAPTGPQPMWGQAPQAQTAGWSQPTQAQGWSQPAQAQTASWSQPAAAPAQAWASDGWTYSQQPSAPASGWGTAAAAPATRQQDRGIGVAGVVGIGLIVIGSIALLNVAIPGWIAPAVTGPLLIMLIGGAFLVSAVRRTSPQPVQTAPAMASASPAPASAASAPAPEAQSETVDDATSIDIPVADASAEPGSTEPN